MEEVFVEAAAQAPRLPEDMDRLLQLAKRYGIEFRGPANWEADRTPCPPRYAAARNQCLTDRNAPGREYSPGTRRSVVCTRLLGVHSADGLGRKASSPTAFA